MKLTDRDLRFVVSRIPRDVRNLLMQRNLFVAGGFIREVIAGGQVSDVDVLGPNEQTLRASAEALQAERDGARLIHTPNAFTVLSPPRAPVQFITRWQYKDADKLIREFDFTVCQACIWYDLVGGWRSVIADDFYIDLAARRLVYTSPDRIEDAGGSMLRVVKFLRRGYTIQPESLAAVISRLVVSVDPVRAPLESDRTRIIHGLLRQVDPLNVVDGFDVVDPEFD